ncbi:MAG: hypothetical protein LZF61_05925 [Nitrosomonas sp.]|nr:MAG: hypothetical protein LZF61_05925 [Nitrosomonas sp.]
MARARNIKPGFYTSEDLVECSLAARLLFPGLWMLADREGRLEDRPKKIKMAIFPADDLGIDILLTELECRGFIKRYEADGKKVISIIQFLEHQNPHGKEQDSVLPDENGFYKVNERSKNGLVTGKHVFVKLLINIKTMLAMFKTNARIMQAQDQHHASPADSLIPESKDTVITHTDYLSQQSRGPTPAASVCLELKKIGIIDLNPVHPKLLMLINAGATIDEFMHAARIAKDKVLQGSIKNKADALLQRNMGAVKDWKPSEMRMRSDGT